MRSRPLTSPPTRHPHRIRRIALVAASVALVPVVLSYLAAIAQPSNSSLPIRSVEWLRDHGAAGLVSKVESVYYSLTAPSKGGPTLRALPQIGYRAGGGTSPARAPAGATHSPLTLAPAGVTYLPAPVAPLIHPALAGEGVWHSTRRGLGSSAPVLVTTLRNLPEYPRVVAALAWIDTSRTTVTLNPGLTEPSVAIPRGPADVPRGARARLLATFNGGFKLKDSGGGFVLHGHTYALMRQGAATLVGYRDGRVDVLAWKYGPRAPSSVWFARQNLPLIVENGRPNPNLNDSPEWGATLGNAVLVWRSAIGVDGHGNLIYLAGDHQTVGSLANTLVHAGAVRAMELDINSYWVSFITYGAAGGIDPTNLLGGMNRPATRYLTPDDRDFFAVYAR